VNTTRFLSTPSAQLAGFVLSASVSFVLSIGIGGAIGGILGSRSQVANMALASGILSILLLRVSAARLRRQHASLRVLGLPTDRARFAHLCFGFVVTAGLFLLIALAQSAAVQAGWEYQGSRGLSTALVGIVMVGSMVLVEELLFRGILLRSLRQLWGDRAAMILSALLFGAYHLVQSHDWAMGAAFRFGTSALGGLVFAWAAIRSGGLALPIGLHLGGNWIQAVGVTFHPLNVTPTVTGIWHVAIGSDDVRRLTAPDVIPHLPFFVAMLIAAVVSREFLRRKRSLDSLTV
jgi:membrane protease YdiL (CAAX protease family)